MEWDTAAADAILRVAGGVTVRAKELTPLRYNKEDLHQPGFIAASSGEMLKGLPKSPGLSSIGSLGIE
jgi:3'(2'), 5'-bisphosphate nucleotidase